MNVGRICTDVIRKFLHQYECQVKFVVDSPEDLEEIKTLKVEIPIPAETIVLMPQGMTPEELQSKQEWLVEICKAEGYRYSPLDARGYLGKQAWRVTLGIG